MMGFCKAKRYFRNYCLWLLEHSCCL